MYLVDGSNVIGQRVGWHRDKPGARRQLVQETERLARASATELAVVFDGPPDPQLTENARLSSVTVYFPHPGSSADDRIVEIVREREDRRNLVIVTSDRGLAERLRPLGVAIIRSGEFRRILEDFTD